VIFVEAHKVGFEKLETTVSGYSPDVVAGTCGIPADDIREAAREPRRRCSRPVNRFSARVERQG
jgi:anaerobic selenocysteine-containing dehydrogenase